VGRGLRIGHSQLAPGTIVTFADTNTIDDLDPADDALANPNHPGTPPWDAPNGGAWSTVLDYCGFVVVPTVGAMGSLFFYGSAGHSAIGACFWLRYDVATKTISRYGRRPLPTNNLYQDAAGTNPDPADFNHTWGDWNPEAASFAEAFRQVGASWRPEGSHTRNRMVFIPAAAAGNALGSIFVAWQPTGVNDATGIRGSFVYDIDADSWSRTANVRPNVRASDGAILYHAGPNVIVGPNPSQPSVADHLDVISPTDKTWVRRTLTAGVRNHAIDSTAFSWVDTNGVTWHVVVENFGAGGSPPLRMFAARVDHLAAGTATSWVDLDISAASWPKNASGNTLTVNWEPWSNGSYYAVNRVGGSNKLWKLAAPVNGLISGTWTISEQILVGTLQASDYDYGRLRRVPALGGFVWHGPSVTAAFQGIRPVDT
jgi:hypothetical protein